LRIKISNTSFDCTESVSYTLLMHKAPDIEQIRHLILFCNHGAHHVAGIFGMVGDGADNFR
jgi:hypothetical protein